MLTSDTSTQLETPPPPHRMWWKMLPHLFVQMKGQRGGQKDKRRRGGVRVWNVTQTSLLFCCLHFLYSMTHFYLLVAPLGVSLFSSTCLFNLSLLFAMLDNICQIWYFLVCFLGKVAYAALNSPFRVNVEPWLSIPASWWKLLIVYWDCVVA